MESTSSRATRASPRVVPHRPKKQSAGDRNEIEVVMEPTVDDRRINLRRRSDRRPPDNSHLLSALDRLRHLYEISRRLADFRSVEETVPTVLAAIRAVLPLDSAMLVL